MVPLVVALLSFAGHANEATPPPPTHTAAADLQLRKAGLANDAGMVNIAPQGSGIFMARDIAFYEAHWQGMDTMNLTAELRQKLLYPKGLRGVIVGEVTLNAALSGMLGGDVIIAVEGGRVRDLKALRDQSKGVSRRNHVAIKVLRKSDTKQDGRFVMNQMTFVLRSRGELGFAQVESAPMIVPGEMRPHPERGPCTRCHSTGAGQFNMPDPDLITLPPPAIGANVPRPHRDRGPCTACHKINQP